MTSPEIGNSINVDGILTNVLDSGEGNVVLLLHGSGPGVSAWANWRLTIPVLSQKFRVVAPDLVGFGYTACPSGSQEYNLSLWTSHLVALLEALKLNKVSIVGNSFGGALALAMAVNYPEKVHQLVLMGSAGIQFDLTKGLDTVWGYEPSIDNMRELLDIFSYDNSIINDELVKLRYQASIRTGVHESFSKMFPSPRQNGIKMLAQPEKDIAAIRHRTLIIHGREDRVIPLEVSWRLHHLISNSQLHIFGQCGHWTQIEHAQEFSGLVLSFLSAS